MKKIQLQKLLPDQKSVRYLLATLFLTLGIYFAYPMNGIVATFPLLYLASLLAYLMSPHLSVHLLTAFAIASFYSMTTAFYSAFFYGGYALLAALCAAVTVRCIRKLKEQKGILQILGLVLSFACGILLTFVFSGTPFGFSDATEHADSYLAKTYPEQKFREVTVYYNLREGAYAAEVEYLFEGNDLSSTVIFGEKVKDGFLDDFVSWMQEKRKSVLIDALKTGSEDVVVDSSGLAEKTPDGVFHGSYGSLGNEMEPLFHFTATFREEKPDRRDFADACRAVMETLKQNGFDYGSITFHGLDVGNVIYTCTVTPDTDPELVLSLVKYAD